MVSQSHHIGIKNIIVSSNNRILNLSLNQAKKNLRSGNVNGQEQEISGNVLNNRLLIGEEVVKGV